MVAEPDTSATSSASYSAGPQSAAPISAVGPPPVAAAVSYLPRRSSKGTYSTSNCASGFSSWKAAMTSFRASISVSFQACHRVMVPFTPLGAGVGVGGTGVGSAFLGTGVGVAAGAQAETSKLTRTRTPNKLNSIFFIFLSSFGLWPSPSTSGRQSWRRLLSVRPLRAKMDNPARLSLLMFHIPPFGGAFYFHAIRPIGHIITHCSIFSQFVNRGFCCYNGDDSCRLSGTRVFDGSHTHPRKHRL